MYCKSCLAANPEGATKCVQCGAPLESAIPVAPPPPSTGGGDFELQPEAAKPTSAFEPPPLPVTSSTTETASSESQTASTDEPTAQPPDHKQNAIIMLVISMLMFPGVCCCGCMTPLVGIVGLIFSTLALVEGGKVRPAYEAGDFAAAEAASNAAQKWLKIGMLAAGGVFLLVVLFNVVWAILYGMASVTSGFNRHFNQ